MGCGMSDNKDCYGRWRRNRSSNGTRIVGTKSHVNFPTAIRSWSITFEHSDSTELAEVLPDVASMSFKRLGGVGSTSAKKTNAPVLPPATFRVVMRAGHHCSTPRLHHSVLPLPLSSVSPAHNASRSDADGPTLQYCSVEARHDQY
jgi:hypothetical protein